LSSLEEEHGGYVCHPRAPSGNNIAGPILLSHPQQGKQRYFRVPSLKLFRKKKKKKKKKRKVDSLGITLSSCCLSGS
jgi:hypothetical protein